ncbi:MAG: restriction endonuclease subunit S [Betaproteobacteria bacterium]|nr:restriction endonuclease subunit S [Betaproteobacteria bacterium]
MQHNEASGVPSLNARTIEGVEILCPSSEEQTAIATVLADLDAEIAALEARLAKARLPRGRPAPGFQENNPFFLKKYYPFVHASR